MSVVTFPGDVGCGSFVCKLHPHPIECCAVNQAAPGGASARKNQKKKRQKDGKKFG